MRFEEEVAVVKSRAAWGDNPYFSALSEGRFSRADFVETQIQFFHAVVFFNRPMAILAGRLPRAALRVRLLENVLEEHGSGSLASSHQATFRSLLTLLGVEQETLNNRAMGPEVRAFNTLLLGVCTLDDPITAMATLGMIEDLFSEISGFLGRQLVERDWLGSAQVVHYSVHEAVDVQHAHGFYEVIRDRWNRDGAHRDAVVSGLELGAYCFLRLYRDLYEARARRAIRSGRGAHSRVDEWAEAMSPKSGRS